MADMKPLEVCRLCLSSPEILDELTGHLTSIISTCFSLKICTSPNLPRKICLICIDQLEKVYIYRKKIIKNELILLKKSKKHTDNFLVKYSNNLQVDYDIDEVKDGIMKYKLNEIVDDIASAEEENDADESNAAVHEDIDIDIKNNDTLLARNISEQMKKEHNLKIESKTADNLMLNDNNHRVADLNDSDKEQSNVKPNNILISEKENINGNINNSDENEKPLVHFDDPTLELLNQNGARLEMDKKNKNFTIVNNISTVNNHCENADVLLNQDYFYLDNIDKKFMCLTCLKVFESQKELSIHYKTVELHKAMRENYKKCKDSSVIATKNDHRDSVFKCGACSKVFENKTTMVKHTQIHNERPFQCNLCSRTYKTVADILRHGVVHNGFKFVCSYECGYTTVHLGALREHVKRHKKEYKYKCEKCGKCFQVKTWYDQHQNVHDKVRPFVCKLCGQAFSMARYLTAHQANVHPQSSKVKRYKCVPCSLPCDSRKSLVIHMKQKHGMKTDCLCDVCGQILPDQHKLILHRSVHEASRKFSCRFCKKTFNKKDHKTVHEKIHTGERLACSSCPKTFTQRCSLRRHMKRYHQGDQLSLEQKT